MTLHLAHFASGHPSVQSLKKHQAETSSTFVSELGQGLVPLYMRNRRTRSAEFTKDSSLYWVITGAFACRQLIKGFEDGIDENGRRFTTMLLDPRMVLVDPRPRRNFGGWRYLESHEVPHDFGKVPISSGGMPESLARELRSLGLL